MATTQLTVALLQLAPAGNDLSANLAKGIDACRKARSFGADIALFPELWSVGYEPAITLDPKTPDLYRSPELWERETPDELPEPEEIWGDLAVATDSEFVGRFQSLATELEMAIALTLLQRWTGLPRDALLLIDRHGRIALEYAKVHTCAFSPTEDALTPGDGFPVTTLDTAVGQVQVGAMICYDRIFPESGRALMLAGAELILVPNASSLEQYKLAQLRARADENMVAIALANYPGSGQGHSIAFDGMPYGDGGPRDMLVVEAGEAAGIYPASFDLDALRSYRRRETEGNAFRRPDTYAALTAPAVRDPFVRVDRSGRPPRWRTPEVADRRS